MFRKNLFIDYFFYYYVKKCGKVWVVLKMNVFDKIVIQKYYIEFIFDFKQNIMNINESKLLKVEFQMLLMLLGFCFVKL